MYRGVLVTVCAVSVCSLAFAFRAEDKGSELVVPTGVRMQAVNYTASSNQLDLLKKAKADKIEVGWDGERAVPVSIRGQDLGVVAGYASSSADRRAPKSAPVSLRERAVVVLDNVAGLLRVKDAASEFTVLKEQKDDLGYEHVRLEQTYKGLRVIGGAMAVHFDNQKRAYEVNGTYVPDVQVQTKPSIDAATAGQKAVADAAKRGYAAGQLTGQPELVIYALKTAPRLAYECRVVCNTPNRAIWRYWIDAITGEVLLGYNDIRKVAAPTASGRSVSISGTILSGEGGDVAAISGWYENGNATYYLHNPVSKWLVYNIDTAARYVDSGTYAHRTTSNWGTSDPTEMSAGLGLQLIQDYYSTIHGRNSFNNQGAMAWANVHQLDSDGSLYVNAYWDGSDFHFGDGDGATANSLAVLDVIGHEYTHGVTEYSANLIYSYESGALNESFSDIFGTCVEFYSQPDGRSAYPNSIPGTADWLLGEDCWLDTVALRDMRNPANPATVGYSGRQPTRYHGTYWYSGSGDNGGVHYNSSVQNFFFYLLTEGGSGNNDGINYQLTGLGLANTEKIAYRALTVYATPYDGYNEIASAWISAAKDLNPSWVGAVRAAWAAVGIAPPSQPSTKLYSYALDTSPGWSTEGLWAFGKPAGLGGYDGGDGHGYADPTNGFTGNNVYGYNLQGNYSNNISGTKWLTTKAFSCENATNVTLVFRRWLGLEVAYYDHAYIEASSNGTDWTRVWDNTGFGWIQDSGWARISLSIAAVADRQKTVYVRWGLGPTDGSWTYCGWNIDDIEIYGDLVADQQITLAVSTTRGTAIPSGTNTYPWYTAVEATVTDTGVTPSGVRYTCIGPTVVGNSYTKFSNTRVTLTITNNTTIDWNWQKDYLIQVNTIGLGQVVTSGVGWTKEGNQATAIAKATKYWNFLGWAGDTNGCVISGSTIRIPADQPRLIQARFGLNWLYQNVLPVGVTGPAPIVAPANPSRNQR